MKNKIPVVVPDCCGRFEGLCEILSYAEGDDIECNDVLEDINCPGPFEKKGKKWLRYSPFVKSLYASRIEREMAPAKILLVGRYHSTVAATDGSRLAIIFLLHDPGI